MKKKMQNNQMPAVSQIFCGIFWKCQDFTNAFERVIVTGKKTGEKHNQISSNERCVGQTKYTFKLIREQVNK